MRAALKQENVSRAEEMLREASGRGMTPSQVQRLRYAWNLERRTRADREEAGRICKDIEAELQEGVNESIALERDRGGAVEILNRGPVRMADRDGLRALLGVKDGLTAAEFDAGLAYREGIELRSCDLASAMAQEASGGAHDNDRYVLARLTRAKKLTRTSVIERAVALECAAEPTALAMLRRVAGDGFPLASQGKGRAFERNLKALKMALGIADAVIRGR